jgi:hypothetical protein
MLREPRREITEIVIGFSVLVPLVWADWRVADLAYYTQGPSNRNYWSDHFIFMVGGAAVGLLAVIIIGLALVTAHWMGEGIANGMAAWGLDPRPRRRFR